MHIRKNDTVKIMIGTDAGKTGKVVKAFPKLGKVLIEGLNMHKKHLRARQEGKKGQEIGLLVKSRVRQGDSVYKI